MSLGHYRETILARFKRKDVIKYSLGEFDHSLWDGLTGDVEQWWHFYKQWEGQDSVADAYKEQRLTVKGTSTMDMEISAYPVNKSGLATGTQQTWEKPKPQSKGQVAVSDKFLVPEKYRIKKTNASIVDRLDPTVFMPQGDGESQKTERGLHDLSTGLMNPKAPISSQQYKTVSADQVYVFMPLSHAVDQAVFQNINQLAKAYREKQGAFYNLVRDIRSKMTRIKLAAEHDLASNFVLAGRTPLGQPKFKLSLVKQTDVSAHDVEAGLVSPKVKFEKKDDKTGLMVPAKTVQVATTVGLLDARKNAALNFQTLILGEMLSYGEVTIAYRKHAGEFPKFVKFVDGVWKVGTIAKNNVFTFKTSEESISDTPT